MHSKQNITSSYKTGNKPTDSCIGGGRGGVGWRLQVLREYSTTDSYIWKLSTISSHKRDKQHFMTQENKKNPTGSCKGKREFYERQHERKRPRARSCQTSPAPLWFSYRRRPIQCCLGRGAVTSKGIFVRSPRSLSVE